MLERIEKRVGDIAGFFENHYRLIVMLTMAAYFLRSFVMGLIKGGRWDLNQNIAMADRFLNGQGLYYSPIEASTPYFPEVTFLSIIVGKLFYPWRDYVLLCIASLVGTAFLYALIVLGERLSDSRVISLTVTFALLSIGFADYRKFMNEFKADSLILLYAILIVLIIDKIENDEWKVGIGTVFALFLLAFLMDLAKQHALYIDAALGVYLLFTKKLERTEKAIILGSLLAAGFLDLAVIFSIPGIEIQAIKNLRDMPYWGIKEIITVMKGVFQRNAVYFVLLFSFAYLLVSKRIRLNALAGKWLMIAMAFGAGQMAGGWKRGGNAGNYEAGMVSFLPFAVVAAGYFFREFFDDNKKKAAIAVMNYTVCGACLVLFAKLWWGGAADC